MDEILKDLQQNFQCRNSILRELVSYINNPDEAFPESLYIFGHAGTGKTAITKHLMSLCKNYYPEHFYYAYVNCVECYTTKLLVSNILEELQENGCCFNTEINDRTCKTIKDFIDILRYLHKNIGGKGGSPPAIIITLDNAERLRDMEMNVLPVLLRLQQLTALNICVVLISQLTFEKYYCKNGLPDPLTLYLPQYNKTEMLQILNADFNAIKNYLHRYLRKQQQQLGAAELNKRLQHVENMQSEFFDNYLNLFLSVFFKVCRELPELRVTARKCFLTYMQPVLDGLIEPNDVSRLWRHIATPLRTALAQVYLRFDQASEVRGIATNEPKDVGMATTSTSVTASNSVCDMAKALELPYYGKYLLIAAFLASYNSQKFDKRLYVKNHGKQRKRMQTVNARAKTADKMATIVGPKSFSIDRLLAIFYAIIEDKVGLTCNLLSQISTLVNLKLLSFVSGEQNIMEGTAKLQCTVGLEFVLCIGRVVGFNVRQYLCDFM